MFQAPPSIAQAPDHVYRGFSNTTVGSSMNSGALSRASFANEWKVQEVKVERKMVKRVGWFSRIFGCCGRVED